MNYIKELNAFYDWLELNSLSTSSIVLWHALMHINNKAGWAKEFTVATSVLEIKTGLTRRTIERARNELKQKGRINWKSRKGNQSAVYTIIPFVRNNDAQHVAQYDAQHVAQSVAQPVAINKLNINKTKQKICSSTTTDEMTNFNIDEHFKELAKLYEQCIGTPNGLTADWIESILEMYGFEWCKNAMLEAEKRGKRTKKYVEGILQNWKRDGGMKLEKDSNNNNRDSNKTFQTRFHNFKQRTTKYTAEELDRIAREKFERKLIEVAENRFNYAKDPEDIEDMLSAEKKLNRLRKLAKKEGVASGNYITSFR